MTFRYQKFIAGDTTKPLVARPLGLLFPYFFKVKIKASELPSPLLPYFDSGADTTMFPADIASQVGITTIETGELQPTIGIAGQQAQVYYHPLSIQVLGDNVLFYMPVGFSKDIVLPILGRSFFLQFHAVIFREEKEQVELRPRPQTVRNQTTMNSIEREK